MRRCTSWRPAIPRACTSEHAQAKSRVCHYFTHPFDSHSGPTDFTGISAPYEEPESPEIHIKTDECDVAESVRRITEYLSKQGFI